MDTVILYAKSERDMDLFKFFVYLKFLLKFLFPSFHSSFFRFFANLKLTEEFLFGRENVKIFMEFYYIVSHFIRRKISAIVFYWILNFLIQKSLSKNLA